MNPAGILLLFALAGLGVQFARLVRRWRKGRPANINWSKRIPGAAYAYFHVVHDVVAREPYAARMHMLAAGGLIAAILLSLPLHILGIGKNILPLIILLALAVSALGVGMAGWRRRGARPRRLSGGGFSILPFALAGALAFLAGAAVIAAVAEPSKIAWATVVAVGAVALGWLIVQAYGGPMRHALAGLAHLVVHPRPARLDGESDAALRPLDLDTADTATLGAGRMTDFAWNRLVSYDACVQCGKCEQACPAFAAGQPLNPKALINDLVRATGPGVATPFMGSPHPGHAAGVISGDGHGPLLPQNGIDGFLSPETIWACTTCRACVQECPMLIEHVDAVVDIRRFATLEQGDVPIRVATALTELRETDTMTGRAPDTRLDWAVDLKLPLMADRERTDVLLWIGEGGFERRSQRTLRALVRLLRIAEVDFAVLGTEELDCGDGARRLGDEMSFQRLAKANIATLARHRFNTILTVDPHVLHTLGKEYPAFGGSYDVVHHSVFLDRLFAEGRLRLADAEEQDRPIRLTYHDPCYLGRYGGEIEAPRRLLDRLGFERVEMERSGMRSSCCGGGGGAPLSDVPGARRIPDMRMDHARATGASLLAVGCPNCMTMLEGVVGPRPEVSDLAELVLTRVEPAA